MSADRSVIWRRLEPVRRLANEAVGVVAALTRPRDAAPVDRIVTTVMAESRAGRTFGSALSGVERAWPRSVAGRTWASIASQIDSPVARVRAAGSVVAIAMTTALVLRLAASRPAPLSWIVPAVAAIAGLIAVAVARPLAAALARRRW